MTDILTPEQAQQLVSTAAHKAGIKLSPEKLQSGAQQVENKDTEKYVKNLTAGQVGNPGNALIWQLGQALSSLTPTQAATIEKEIPAGSVLAEGVNLAMNPSLQPASSPSQPTNALVQALSNLYTGTISPAIQNAEKSSSQNVDADIAGMQQALKGASPQVQSAMTGIPQTLQTAEDEMSQATQMQTASAPVLQALLQALTQESTGYKGAQTALGVLPYYSAAIQGTTPNIPGGALQNGLLAPPHL